jgi:GNAT superfamily N-acetyltransferase
MKHHDHDAVAAEVASWYASPVPEMGLDVVASPYGWYRTNRKAREGWATIAKIRPSDVEAMLEDVKAFYGDRPVEISVEDATYSPAVGAALEGSGWTNTHATVWLAHVGDERIPGVKSGVDIKRVGVDQLDGFSRTKLMGFAESEDEPSVEQIAQESSVRRSDLMVSGVCLEACVGSDCVAICAYYTGKDYFIFLVATRVPFRRRGLARSLIAYVHDEAVRANARSTIINADEGRPPEALYRSLGFTDVVYRQWRFKRVGQQ